MWKIQEPLSFLKVQSLIDQVFSDYRLNKLADFENDHANLTNLLEFSLPGGGAKQIVLKCYIGKGASGRMSREFSALQWLIQRGILVPEPIFQDAKGVHLGKPCIIMTGYISGQCVMAPHNTQERLSRAEKLLAFW